MTHRCHKKEFLLKFARDRRRWLQWLFEAKKRYGIRILNYMITSNHIHLLVVDGGGRDVILKSIKLVAGRTGQEYNQRKNRKGLFISAGATKGKKLFDGTLLTVKYFFDVLDMELWRSLLYRSLDFEDDVLKHPEYLEEAYHASKEFAQAL